MRVAGVAVVLAVVALVPSGVEAAPNMSYGFSTGSINSLPDPVQAAEAAAGASANAYRIEVNWARLQPRKNSSWDQADVAAQVAKVRSAYDEALRRGVKPLLLVWFPPEWARDTVENLVFCSNEWDCVLPPADSALPDWQAFVKRIATEFPDAVGIQVWNEPNNSSFWRSGSDPVRYTRVLRYAYQGVREASATMPVSAFSLAIPDPAADPAIGWSYSGEVRDYLTRAYQSGAKNWYDKFAAHPYPVYPNAGSAPDGNSAYTRKLNLVREVRAQHGDTTPIWITEWGYFTGTSSRAVTEAQQAHWIECGYRLTLGMPDVEMLLIYTLRDLSANDPGTEEANFGVMYNDLTPKLAYRQLQDMFATGRASQPVTSCDSVP